MPSHQCLYIPYCPALVLHSEVDECMYLLRSISPYHFIVTWTLRLMKIYTLLIFFRQNYYACETRGGTSCEKLGGKNISAAVPTIPLTGSTCPFLPSSWGHACCDQIICRHCVDQQSDSLVFTEVHSDLREWNHWNVGGQRHILAPCIEIWRGIRTPCPTACSTLVRDHTLTLLCSVEQGWTERPPVSCTRWLVFALLRLVVFLLLVVVCIVAFIIVFRCLYFLYQWR